MSIVVRKAEEKDNELVRSFIYKLAEFEGFTESCTITSEALYKLLFEERAMHSLIAQSGERAVGFALYYFSRIATFAGKRVLYIEDLYVGEECRGSGVGTAILEELKRIGREAGCVRLEWKCLEWNKKAAAFYESCGAKATQGWITYNFDL